MKIEIFASRLGNFLIEFFLYSLVYGLTAWMITMTVDVFFSDWEVMGNMLDSADSVIKELILSIFPGLLAFVPVLIVAKKAYSRSLGFLVLIVQTISSMGGLE